MTIQLGQLVHTSAQPIVLAALSFVDDLLLIILSTLNIHWMGLQWLAPLLFTASSLHGIVKLYQHYAQRPLLYLTPVID